jgi:uncharacterized membrane protein YoaK (UPF0700 family)
LCGREIQRDILLIALTVASGSVDAISYFGLGKTFSAFMTGNIVFLGFGIAHLGGPAIVPVIVALSMFATGVYVGLRIWALRGRDLGLWPPRMSVLLLLVAIGEAGFLAVWAVTSGQQSTVTTDLLLGLFSVAMGIQTAAVRSLGVQGVFTTAGTFTLVAVVGILAGARPRAEMRRLAGVLIGLVSGAVAGGLLFLHARSAAPVLPLVITILVALAGCLVRA